MKVSKYIVLVAGVLGLVSCLVPDVGSGTSATIRAFQRVHGGDVDQVADGIVAMNVPLMLPILAPLVGAVFCLLGVVGMGRQSFGRLAGTLAMLTGLVELAMIADVIQGSDVRVTELVGIAVAIVGAIGGAMAVLSPERVALARFPRPPSASRGQSRVLASPGGR